MDEQQQARDRDKRQGADAGGSDSIPLDQSDLVEKMKDETSGEPVGDKAKTGIEELGREVSGNYEARQERVAPEKVSEDIEKRS